jgi:cell division protein FtsB
MAATQSTPKPDLEKDYPAQIYQSAEYQPPEYVAYLERASVAIRSLKLVVAAILAISIVLAVYGFFLIYKLTHDTHQMVLHASRMADEMETMGRNIDSMRASVGDMRTDISALRDSIVAMNRNVASIDNSVAHMASTVGLIQHSTANLDRSFGPAMGMLNNVMPFGFGGNNWPGAPPFAPPVPGQPR